MSTDDRRLLLVGNGWGRDGAPLLLLALARGYAAAGYRLTSAAPGDGPLRADFAALGETVSLPDWHGSHPRASFLAAAARLTALAADHAAVVANTSQALAGVIAARALNKPCVWCIREGADPRTLPFGRWLERACGRGVDLAFEAEAVRRLWAPWLKGPSHVIPNGVPDPGPGDRAAARAALGIDPEAFVALQVGTVCHRKGQDLLFEAATRAPPDRDLRLVLQGGDAAATQRALRFLFVGGGDPLGDAPNVTWVGELADVAPWYRAADVVVSPSREESHPRVVLEALAHGRAVVATRVGGVPEQVAHEIDGSLLSPDVGWFELQARLLHLRGRPRLQEQLETDGRARYEAAFREERMVADHVALLDRVLRRPGAGDRVRRLLHGSGGRGRLARAREMVRRLGWKEALRAARGTPAPRRADRPWPSPGDAPPAVEDGPRFSLVVRPIDTETLQSVKRQRYARWTLALSPKDSQGDYVIELGGDDVLEPDALGWLAAAIAEDPTREVVYGDRVVAGELRLLPGYCPELLLGAPYLGAPVAIHRRLIDAWSAPVRMPHGVLLRACEQARGVHRVPRVLSRSARPLPPARRAAQHALKRRGLAGEVRPHPAVPDALEVRLSPPVGTRAALIVPTRDRGELLAALCASLKRTTWPEWSLVIVDNGSRDSAALAAIRAAEADGATVIVRDVPFDHGALCNAGAEAAGHADVLVFLNDDVEVIAPDWLEDLLALATAPGIGAVGARLLYPDGRLQHGGVVLGIGPDRIAGHAHLGEPAHSIGELGLTRLLGNCSAVTGACLAVARERFEAVGGFDPAFPTDYDDVDLCLRLRAQGLRTAWTPRAELLHHGGATRPRAIDPEAIRRFRERWAPELRDDPCYHPLRTRTRQDYGWGE